MSKLRTSIEGLELIKYWEGLKLTAYTDQVGKVTIGYGHVIPLVKSACSINSVITLAKAIELFTCDILEAERSVKELVKAPVTQGQFNALVSLVFNIGEEDLRHSKALKLINNLQYAEAAEELFSEETGFVFAGGKKNKGLINRRTTERKMWESYII